MPRNLLSRLDQTVSGELDILSFHPGVAKCRDKLAEKSADRTIVTLGGVDENCHNLTLIAEAGEIVEQAKLSLASEDEVDGVVPGDTLHLFEDRGGDAVRWAVLNCHDYSHADLIAKLLDLRIELLVVVTFNPATQLYWEYATADIHRLFCYVVIVNVAELGGSGVFVPFRRIGTGKNASIRAAGQVFSTRGPAETSAVVPLDIAELRRLREKYRNEGLSGPKDMGSERYAPLAPSEHFMSTFDRPANKPPVAGIETVEIEWNGTNPLVAVAQLDSMTVDDYIDSKYRLENAEGVGAFEARIASLLDAVEVQLSHRPPEDRKLDFIVFPEVFLPRRFITSHIEPFTRRTGAIALCGVDYPGTEESDNRNSCMVVGPAGRVASYDKITRSQYDAIGKNGRMPMCRGHRLYRFVNPDGHAFGVLICYDFSHFDLVHQINLKGRDAPLDILFVVAHNPFGGLYRTCCIADSHRFYQHVVLCNVSAYGGSGVFAPVRTGGTRQTLLDLGMKSETIALSRLDLLAQRAARAVVTDDDLHKGRMMRRPGIFQGRISFD